MTRHTTRHGTARHGTTRHGTARHDTTVFNNEPQLPYNYVHSDWQKKLGGGDQHPRRRKSPENALHLAEAEGVTPNYDRQC
jgi:hypothetical protein